MSNIKSKILGIRISEEDKILIEKQVKILAPSSSVSNYLLYLIQKGIKFENELLKKNKANKDQLDIYSKIQ